MCDNNNQMSTYKQKMVASKLVENGGNIGKAMIDAGYSPATAKTPQKLTESKGWQELMKNYFPDEELVKTHRSLFDAEKQSTYIFSKSDSNRSIKEIIESIPSNKLVYVRKTKAHKIAYYAEPDNVTIGKALDLAYKVKGYYHHSRNNNLGRTNNLENFNIDDDQLKRIIES